MCFILDGWVYGVWLMCEVLMMSDLWLIENISTACHAYISMLSNLGVDKDVMCLLTLHGFGIYKFYN